LNTQTYFQTDIPFSPPLMRSQTLQTGVPKQGHNKIGNNSVFVSVCEQAVIGFTGMHCITMFRSTLDCSKLTSLSLPPSCAHRPFRLGCLSKVITKLETIPYLFLCVNRLSLVLQDCTA